MRHPTIFKVFEHGDLRADGEFHRAQLRRFSEYGVIFTLVGDTFWIVAVAHAKRRPGYWARRVKGVTEPPRGDQA